MQGSRNLPEYGGNRRPMSSSGDGPNRICWQWWSYENEIIEWINIHVETVARFDAPLLRITGPQTHHWAIEVVRDPVGSIVVEKVILNCIRLVLQSREAPLLEKLFSASPQQPNVNWTLLPILPMLVPEITSLKSFVSEMTAQLWWWAFWMMYTPDGSDSMRVRDNWSIDQSDKRTDP
jgi:hypothetical protein